mmetsp:Transcript_2985/g.9026  ORF Transcript_2985/g.9026 Transcript_2985/m.9026 type:complete len:105 (-) Transcript_2985:38-352(-)
MPTIAVAKFPFNGEAATELSFAKGERITVVAEEGAGDWWKGELNGKTGYFPSSYCNIERVAAATPPPPAQAPPVAASRPPPPSQPAQQRPATSFSVRRTRCSAS